MESAGGAEEQDPYDEQLFNMPCKFSSLLMITVQVNQAKLQMEVDTGASASIISYDTFMEGWPALQTVLSNHTAVFADELGCVKGVKAKIYVNPEARPRFCKPRSVPFAFREKVNKELERLEKSGVIEPVQHADWAAPIVPKLKKDGSVRICGDYKLTVNQAAKTDSFPLPRIDDLFASLAGGQAFSKLDLAHAYLQLELNGESKKLVTINTQKGLFQYNRLPFGVSAAPSIFQRTIEGVLQGIPNVCVYLDDILITGKTNSEHLMNLHAVLTRLEEAGMRLKRKKCSFLLHTQSA